MDKLELMARLFIFSALIHYGIFLANDVNTSFYQMLFILSVIGISLFMIDIKRILNKR